MMKQNNLEPKRRFENFEEDWEQYELKESVELENGYAFKSRYFQSDVTKEIVLTPGNVNIGGGFQVGKGHYYDASEDYPEKTVMKPGDIFVTMTDLTPSAQTLGFPAIIPDDGNVYLHNQRLGKLVNYKLDNKFLFNLLSTIKYHNQIVNTASGTTVKHTSPQRILSSLVSVPSIEEQKKVGQFFTHLDDMIALQQKKIEKTKALKSAYLAEMFPAEGESVPKRRFAGFTDEWKRLKLNMVADYRNGKAHEQNVVNDGKYIIVNSKFVSTNGYTKKYSDKQLEPLMIGEIAFVLSDVPNGRAVARTYLIEKNNKFTLNQRIAGITPNENSDSYFLKELMNRHKYFLNFDDGVGQTNISNKDLENFEVYYPDFTEQNKIGLFFEKIDDVILNHQQKLDKLKVTKQAYLNEMFV